MTAAWGWLVILLGNVLGITGYDLWLHFTGRHTLTRQMHDWVFHSQAAQFIIPGVAAFLIWFTVHEIIYHPKG